MEFYMLVLALDTTTRQGSVALVRDGQVLDCWSGDPAVTHGRRLPGEVIGLLGRQKTAVGDVELFAVAAGPGSFTGLRIGIATMQGLAFANGRSLVGISTLDALNNAARAILGPEPSALSPSHEVGALMDAQRGEVFAALYRDSVIVDGPSVEKPDAVLSRWRAREPSGAIAIVGEGALVYDEAVRRALPGARIVTPVPALAPSIALLAERDVRLQTFPLPDVIRPIYVRRPDVELARDRQGGVR
jgi:tRNA threonylcarbamoyladenosine biosynthesis protein TsaB